MFARGETEEKMGAGFPLLECQQFLPRPKLPPPAQASAAHKIPEKGAFFVKTGFSLSPMEDFCAAIA